MTQSGEGHPTRLVDQWLLAETSEHRFPQRAVDIVVEIPEPWHGSGGSYQVLYEKSDVGSFGTLSVVLELRDLCTSAVGCKSTPSQPLHQITELATILRCRMPRHAKTIEKQQHPDQMELRPLINDPRN